MNLYKFALVFSIAVLTNVLFSCTEDYDMNLKNTNLEPTLVVDGVITDKPGPYFLALTLSADYFSNEFNPGVKDASVVVSDGVNDIVYSGVDGYPGLYRSPNGFRGEVGKTYSLSVTDVDIDEDGVTEAYTAQSYLGACNPIDSATIDYEEMRGGKYWRVFLHAKDNPETDDFYIFKVYKNDTIVSKYMSDWSSVSDEYFDEEAEAHEDVYWLQDEDEDGVRNEDAPSLDDIFTLEMCRVSEMYFDYVIAVQEEMRPKVPLFSSPAANVPSNISGEAYGFFEAYSVRRGDVKITQEILDLKENY